MPQATIREPAKKNMYKGICLAYSVITTTYWLVAFLGYWAFGFAVQAYVVNSFSGPNWAITMANVFAVIQVAGCFQVCYKPITHYHIPNKSTSLVHGFLLVLANIITESSPPPRTPIASGNATEKPRKHIFGILSYIYPHPKIYQELMKSVGS
jgi:magnesium-transporting ATPase (P-type)